MDITIRPRDPGDLPDLAPVLVRVHAVDGYPVEGVAAPEDWLTPPRELAAWTAVYDGVPVGHISLAKADSSDDAAAVWQQTTGHGIEAVAIPVRLFVDPDHRDQGAGKFLMLAAHTYAAEHGLTLVFDVMLKDHAAIRLYESVGCQRLGTIEHHHSDGETEPAAVYVAPDAGSFGRPE